jgi:hypothetical protein
VHRRASDVAASLRLVAASLLAAVAVALPPAITGESPSAVLVASLALLVAALVAVEGLGWRLALTPAYALATAVETPLHRPARVTDRVHHPIRPRAPGC